VPTFVQKCLKTLGQYFINNRGLAMGRHGDFAELRNFAATGYCPCHALGGFCVDGHVATADCSIVSAWRPQAFALQDLFVKGVKYRPRIDSGVVTQATIEDMVQAVDRVLPTWIGVLERTLEEAGGPTHI
jgi:hypothetical protein